MSTANETNPEAAVSPARTASGENSESFDDVRKFIGSLSSRSCEEAIGLSNQGGLVAGIVQATVGFAVVLIAFTAIPYWMGSHKPAPTAKPEAATAAAAENPVTPPVTAGETDGEGDVDLSKAANVMGIDETKSAAPNENPLDKKLDNLLDGVE